jgi:hypothetical protein
VADHPSKNASQDSSNDSSGDSGADSDGWAEYRNILFLKQLGFSLDEMREITMTQFMVFTDLSIPDADTSQPAAQKRAEEIAPGIRKATQADIDNFFGF